MDRWVCTFIFITGLETQKSVKLFRYRVPTVFIIYSNWRSGSVVTGGTVPVPTYCVRILDAVPDPLLKLSRKVLTVFTNHFVTILTGTPSGSVTCLYGTYGTSTETDNKLISIG